MYGQCTREQWVDSPPYISWFKLYIFHLPAIEKMTFYRRSSTSSSAEELEQNVDVLLLDQDVRQSQYAGSQLFEDVRSEQQAYGSILPAPSRKLIYV